MSRIHEALRKAQEERAAQGAQEPESPASVLEVVTEEPPLPVAPARPVLGRAGPAGGGEVLTVEMLETRCRKTLWKPERKTALLFSADSHARGSEELRTLRSRLYQIRQNEPLQKVLVTSALPADGKTFVTINLGQMIVRQPNRRVLIIDADLRRSQMHNALGAPPSPGVTDYLKGTASELDIIQRGPVENFYFIPGGTEDQHPAELLANGRMKILLDRLAPLFDWILVDSPPALPVADGTQLAALCDGVLLVVHAGRTPFDMAQRARDEFRDRRILGVVLNRVSRDDTYSSYYYSYYKDGYGSGKKNGRDANK
jgi:protein-tyrosine kinase